MNKVALVDGDSFLYRAGFAVEKTKYLVVDPVGDCAEYNSYKEAVNSYNSTGGKLFEGYTLWNRKELGTVEDAIEVIDSMLRNAIEKADCSTHFVYLSASSGNFRDALGTLKRYKGNRDNRSRPVYYSDLREHILTNWAGIVARQEEADDRLSWVAAGRRDHGDDYVVVGNDKDLKQIPGKHYDWVKDESFEITDDEAVLNFWEQVLTGDQNDNIGGCWGLGEKGARKFLQKCHKLSDEEMWPKIVRKYEDSKKKEGCPYVEEDTEKVALETARLVRLRRHPGEIWTPDTKEWNGKKKSAGSAEEPAPF